MSRPSRVVIVGASIGGLTAAEALRDEGFTGEIDILGEESLLPYTRPPLSKQILAGEWEPDQAQIRTRAELDDLGIRIHTDTRARGLDTESRSVRTSTGTLDFDELIIATGTRAHTHPLLPHAPALRTADDAVTLRDGLTRAQRVAVIGSGILGSEVATAARKFGAETLLIGRSGKLSFGGAGTLLSERLAGLHEANGVELALKADIRSATPTQFGATELVLGESPSQSFDLVVAMIGGSPNTEWLAGSGLKTVDGVSCDSAGIAAPGISAVGDVAAWQDPTTGQRKRVEHQSNAIEQALAVASRIVKGADVKQPVPLFWSEIHGARIKAYGWFDERRPLLEASTEPHADAQVLYSHDSLDALQGVVAWNAPAREFHAARVAVMTSMAAEKLKLKETRR